MKRILLTSTALVAFAGAAAAEVSFSGTAFVNYSSEDSRSDAETRVLDVAEKRAQVSLQRDEADDEGSNKGLTYELDMTATLSEELDNGLSASATFNFEVADENIGQSLESADYALELTSDNAGFAFGDVKPAAIEHWEAIGDMEEDGFTENDGETFLRGDVSFGDIDGSVSYFINPVSNTLDQLSLGGAATVGDISLSFGYQTGIRDAQAQSAETVGTPEVLADDGIDGTNGNDDDIAAVAEVVGTNTSTKDGSNFNSDKTVLGSLTATEAKYVTGADFSAATILGFSAKGTLSGFDLGFGYASKKTLAADTADDSSNTSIGLSGGYSVGDIKLEGYFVKESAETTDDQGTTDTADDVTTKDGNNYGFSAEYPMDALTAKFELKNEQGTNKMAVTGTYDLGNGIELGAGAANSDGDGTYFTASYDLGGGASALFTYADKNDAGGDDLDKGMNVKVSFAF